MVQKHQSDSSAAKATVRLFFHVYARVSDTTNADFGDKLSIMKKCLANLLEIAKTNQVQRERFAAKIREMKDAVLSTETRALHVLPAARQTRARPIPASAPKNCRDVLAVELGWAIAVDCANRVLVDA